MLEQFVENSALNAIAAKLGIYSVQDAARLSSVPAARIRGWLLGYGPRRGRDGAPAVLRPQHTLRHGELALGFFDLLEVAFLGRLVQAAERQGRRPSWKSIRLAADTARRMLGTEHPFAARRLHTDGKRIFAEARGPDGANALYDLVGDNFAIYDFVARSFVATVEYEHDTPLRWTPDTRFPRIIVDPLRAFGRPIESASGVPAETLFDAWLAEANDAAKVAAFFGVDPPGVDEAVGFVLGTQAPIPRAA